MQTKNSENDLHYLVSNFDIQKKFKAQNIKIVTFEQLSNYNNLEQLLPQNECALFILLKTSENAGHWTVTVRYNNNVYYFDSYGVIYGGELKNISPELRYELGENKKTLTNLINKSNFNVSYNHKQLQSHHTDINTCGKWCTVFAKTILSGITLKGFIAGIEHLKNVYEKEHPDTPLVYDHIASMLYFTY